MFEIPILTQRLRLRRLVPADAGAMFAYRSAPDVARFQGWEPASTEEVAQCIARWAGMDPITPGEWFPLGITLRDTDTLAGDCAIHARADDPRQVELGINLAPPFQHRGLAREAVSAMLSRLFTQTGTHRAWCSVDPRNAACISLLENLGMRKEAHLVQSLWLKDEWVDDLIFAMLRTEWRGAIEGG